MNKTSFGGISYFVITAPRLVVWKCCESGLGRHGFAKESVHVLHTVRLEVQQ